jgi:hypothetical protein
MAARTKKIEFGGDPRLSTMVDVDTWMTPQYILGQLGKFDLDPCAAEANPRWTGARFYFSKTSNGLDPRCVWHGRVFMNPPFSNTGPWIRRHAEHGNGISLVPASVESEVWREVVWKKAKAVLLLHGRTRFCNPDGSSTTGRPLRSIALIAWSDYDVDVLEVSTLAGVLLETWHRR